MMFRAFLGLVAGLAAMPLSAGETLVKAKLDAGDASGLAELLLDPEVQKEIVDVSVRRMWAPGDVWRATFLGKAQPLGQDICLRNRYWVDLKAEAEGGISASETSSTEDLTVLPIGESASHASCGIAEDFINASYPANRLYQVEAYRMLRRMMHDAAGEDALPFEIECTDEDSDICSEPRAAFAELPTDKLFAVNVLNAEKRQMEGMSRGILTHPPIAIGKPYTVEVSFGRSGPDGKSWRVYWTMEPDVEPIVQIRRQTVIYH